MRQIKLFTMQHAIYTILAISLAAILASCDLETSSNGKLDGYWKMASIDSIESGTAVSMKEELRFWAFQHKLLQLIDRNSRAASYFMRFEKNGSSLRLYEPYHHKSQLSDEPLEDISKLKAYGLSEADQTFNIEKLSGSTMILSNGKVRINFKKY